MQATGRKTASTKHFVTNQRAKVNKIKLDKYAKATHRKKRAIFVANLSTH